ncbi:MAG: peptidylprolyl isomerase [Candidatus Dormibacteria bacterium]|jgi:cyclophilin family peptidyl-prolyl cis-trans isomerase
MKPPTTPRRLPFIIAATATLVVAAIAGAVALDQADSHAPVGTATTTSSATPTPSASATPTPAIIAYADCSTATFGPALSALNPPSDVHVYSAEPAMTIDQSKLYEATIVTSKGDIVLCLQPDLAPHTVNNFVTLARNGFYNNIPFARVVAGFVIQTGDPNCIGNVPAAPATPSANCGSGGPGYSFDDEPVHEKYVEGAVAMANGGANTNGSQFFICIADDTSQLALSYNLFGQVVSGQSVANSIAQGDVMESVTVAEQT